ncbi:unnamed protein product [Schistosoma margrebowiei]|uniref:IFT80/172/WDR35 TPR domain-containing protein n=1 Tax=Schistosoma margrebowiei TaxID=48269 RepID=A0A183LHV6_9TREM|nr:unnamed protein product [Schistosoma margrebowiei]
MVVGDQRLVHTSFIPAGYWSPYAPLVWDPVKAPEIRFSSSHFREQHPPPPREGSEYQEAEAILLQNHLYFRAIMLNLHAFKWNRALELANKYNLAIDIVLSMRHDYLKQLNRVEELHLFNSQLKQAS